MASSLCMHAAYADKLNDRGDEADSYVPLDLSIENSVVAEASTDSSETDFIKTEEVKELPLDFETPQVKVRATRYYEIGPLPGLGLTKNEIPGNVQSITAKDIKESHSVSMTDLFSKKLQSVTINDYQGNPFQMDVQYRGFTAGPQIGTPQGLSVFFDGIRVNEPFGDIVNWDMMPMNAISRVDVFPGSNPIFGLNTLGGAFTLKTKDGFNFTETDIQLLSGSYGRNQLQAESGWNNGKIAVFGAGTFFMEDGWRQDSPSEVNQFFGKTSYRDDKLDLSLSTLMVSTKLVGNGLLPSEMYAQDHNASFTSEDTTKNRLAQFQLASAFQVNDSFSITGQVYRRNSNRHQVGADVFTDYPLSAVARRLPADGEEFTCVFKSTNDYGLPDYIVVPVDLTANGGITAPLDLLTDFYGNAGQINFTDPLSPYTSGFNAELDDDFASFLLSYINQESNVYENSIYNVDSAYTSIDSFGPQTLYTISQEVAPGFFIDMDIPLPAYSAGGFTFGTNNGFRYAGQTFPGETIYFGAGDIYYIDTAEVNGQEHLIQNFVFVLAPINDDQCDPDSAREVTADGDGPYQIAEAADNSVAKFIDGAAADQSGHVEGTPTALLTDNQIDQIVEGVSVQFNWNLDHHKFMVGASIDDASATYQNTQRLGFLDKNRKAYLDPDQAHPQFAVATIPLSNNDFSGTNTTKSLYFSETWSPVQAWNFNASARYNATQTQNKIAARWGSGFTYGAGEFYSYPDVYAICTGDEDCANTPRNYRTPIVKNNLNQVETETFSYYSFNPSLGVTWQAKEDLNMYANWAQGSRVPSVIELGCAFDETPTYIGGDLGDKSKPENYKAKSIAENRSCSLPTLSGDPYLEQIKSTSYDIGLRGNIGNNMQWNLGAYQTDLEDDIYFVAVGGGYGFFDSIGNTRRRGLEAGLSGRSGKFDFGLNYGLTDATFQNKFVMLAEDNNSSTYSLFYNGNIIEVNKGDHMPGVSLHNLSANIGYQFTSKWHVGMSMVAHSGSFVRGNENNKHRVGVTQYRTVTIINALGNPEEALVARPVTNNPGKLPGYATFNFQSSYKFNKAWTATLLVNNLFDNEYFTAGALGRNPFSPSIQGAIGPDGYNHNSNDWLSTNFIAPSAPRGVWLNVNWQFD